MDFEWRTLEDEGQEAAEPLPAVEITPGRSLRWLAVLIPILIIGTAVYAIYQSLDKRAQAAEASIQADVLSSERLIRQAAAQRDSELFASLLSGSDQDWSDGYQWMLAEGILFDRPAFGLTWQHREARAVTVTLSPDMTEAEVTADLYYIIQEGDGLTSTIVLQNTDVYRLGRQRWLLAPPSEDFWGQLVTIEVGQIRLTAPARDEVIARRLAADLNEIINETCASVRVLLCMVSMQWEIRLATSPYLLQEQGEALFPFDFPSGLVMPTPTWLGLPTDEASSQAIRRGYAAILAEIIISQQFHSACCEGAIFYQALVDAQLAELALRPWPLAPADYEQFLARPPSLEELLDQLREDSADSPAGDQTDVDWRPIYALVEFMLDQGQDIPLTAEDRHILDLARDYDWRSLVQILNVNLAADARERAWLRFLYERSQSGQTVVMPEVEIQMLCRPTLDLSDLYRFDSIANQWQLEAGGRPFVSMTALPTGGVMLEEEPRDTLAQTLIWQDGRQTTAYPNTATFGPATFFNRLDPAGQRLLVAVPSERGADTFRLLDLSQCSDDNCPATPISGFPIWSPDGTKTLIIGRQARLFLADGAGQNPQRVGTGSSPFWLDNERYGYLRWQQVAVGRTLVQKAQLMTATTEDDEATMVLAGEDLLAAVPAAERPDSLNLQLVLPSPAEPGLLFLVAATDFQGERQFYLFAYQADSGDLSLRLLQIGDALGGLQFSPDGRWLALTSLDDRREQGSLYLHEVATNSTRFYRYSLPETAEGWSAAWSADSRWLALPTKHMVVLLAPAENHYRWLMHDFTNCGSAVWLGS